ncbi:predicted protein [Sparassis crispa]|uniref:Uncharacterized protein n=1 Tax=Sparassis crispa TaxID=139825 RepID=A0A401GS97_9APHY|nr:predicted protein [Sparassis crispa]GBE85040.1 predicted protein [Sparassis crispa]
MSESTTSTTATGEVKLTQFKALLFDVYGTLVDWESGIYKELHPLFPRAIKAEVIHAFDNAERELQKRFPTMRYSDILGLVHEELEKTKGDEVSAASADAHVAFGQSIVRWPVFPDTIPALTYLATRYKLTVLSNVDHTSFAYTQRALEGPPDAQRFTFTAVYTAEDAGAYKPAPGALAYALKRLETELGVRKEEVLVVANSVFHDILPARKVGIEGVWIAREGATAGQLAGEGEKLRWVFKTLGDMAEAVKQEGH